MKRLCGLAAAVILLFSCPTSVGAQFPHNKWADTIRINRLIEESKSLKEVEKPYAALEKANEAYALSVALYGEDHPKSAWAAQYVARCYKDTDREAEALPIFEKCLMVFEQDNDTLRQALCHNNVGICLREIFRFADSYRHFQDAIALLRPDSAKADYALRIAEFKINLAGLHNYWKNYDASLQLLKETRPVFLSTKKTRQLGYADYFFGGAYFGLHDYSRAREHYLSAWSNLQGVLPPEHSYFADLYFKIGLCNQQIGDIFAANLQMQKAKEVYLTNQMDDRNYIKFLGRYGRFLIDNRAYEEATAHLNLSLKAKENKYGPDSKELLETLFILGKAYNDQADFKNASVHLRRGIQIISDSCAGEPALLYPFIGRMAAVALARGDYVSCIRLCDSVFTLSGFDPEHPERLVPRDYAREICRTYAGAHFSKFTISGDQNALMQAERYYALASDILFNEVEEIAVNSSRELLYDQDHEVLDEWLHVRMLLFQITGRPEHAQAAFQITGLERAFLLSEAVRHSGALRYAGIPGDLYLSERRLRNSIAENEKKLAQWDYSFDDLTDSVALALNRQLSDLRWEHEALLHQIERDYPAYYQLRSMKSRVSLQDLQRKIVADDQALLMYSLAGEQAYAFVVTRDTMTAVSLGKLPALAEEVSGFNRSLTAYFSAQDAEDGLYDASLSDYLKFARSLYDQLILPLEELLPERVVIIPAGLLWQVPFEALLPSEPVEVGNFKTYPFWAASKAISYALSPDFVAAVPRASDPAVAKSWLGLAPFATTNPEQAIAVRSDAPERLFFPLPSSGIEIQSIAEMVNGVTWSGASSTLARFLREAPNYRTLHLATHSRADDRQGDYSYLVMSPNGERMPAKDMYQMSLSADMVVLSACEAGGGKLINGEGIIGLVRAFTYAGARSVVASQWLAGDQSTAELMIEFYRQLQKGLPRDKALQAAQLHLIRNFPAQAHPFFWAGFRLYGASR